MDVKKYYESISASLQGWCTVEKANKLIDIVGESKPWRIVELGVFCGKSLLALALAAKYTNPQCEIIGIDAWEASASLEGTNDKANDDWWKEIDYNWAKTYTENLMRKENVRVSLWKNKSSEVASKFPDNSIDILHQDSNHSEEISCTEVELYWMKVRKGGYWIFDDTNWATTQKAQDLLLTKGFEVVFIAPEKVWTVYRRI